MTRTDEHLPADPEVAAARRLLGLRATAGRDDVEAAVRAALAAISVPDDAPDLVATAAHLERRIERAGAVLLTTLPSAPTPPVAPPPPVPPPPPVSLQFDGMHSPGPAPSAADHRAARAARARKARQERSAHTRAGVHAIVLVAVLVVLGGAAFVVTRALSGSGPPPRAATSSAPPQTTPPTTVPQPTFSDLLVSGAMGRSDDGLAAGSAREALAAWLAGYQREDAAVVARGIDDESRLIELAEIGSRSVPADVDRIDCSAFGTGTWRCKVGAVTSATRRVEVSRTSTGWHVRGWYTS